LFILQIALLSVVVAVGCWTLFPDTMVHASDRDRAAVQASERADAEWEKQQCLTELTEQGASRITTVATSSHTSAHTAIAA
jgi:hypothetical protein